MLYKPFHIDMMFMKLQWLSEEDIKLIDELKEKGGFRNRPTVIREALRLLEEFMNEAVEMIEHGEDVDV